VVKSIDFLATAVNSANGWGILHCYIFSDTSDSDEFYRIQKLSRFVIYRHRFLNQLVKVTLRFS
ncbi:MAG: hypothetical protein AAFU84_19500, partial [Cyanobacteria bacterium J06633_23]